MGIFGSHAGLECFVQGEEQKSKSMDGGCEGVEFKDCFAQRGKNTCNKFEGLLQGTGGINRKLGYYESMMCFYLGNI